MGEESYFVVWKEVISEPYYKMCELESLKMSIAYINDLNKCNSYCKGSAKVIAGFSLAITE